MTAPQKKPLADTETPFVRQGIRDINHGYKVATDILVGCADLGISGDVYDFIWSICEREAKQGPQ